jgi:O-acetyl-ADP-ribose deacetylase (regulator of RNase III)
MRIGIENVKLATKAALDLAINLKIKSIAIPGMGTGVGGVGTGLAAKAIVEIARQYEDKIEKIILVDRNSEMIEDFEKYKQKK